MKPFIRKIGIVILLIVLMLRWGIFVAKRQAQLDHALITAIKTGDDAKALAALAQGANGEAINTDRQFTDKEVLLLFLDRFRSRNLFPSEPEEEVPHVPALLLLYIKSEKDKYGQSADRSWPGPNPAVVKALLDHGAHVEDEYEPWGTPFTLACRDSNVEAVRLLLEHGASIKAQEKTERGSLLVGANPGVAKLLLDHGANIEAVDVDGWTALMRAADLADSEVVGILLEHGANIDAKNNNHETALDCAKLSLNGTPETKRQIIDLLARHRVK